MYLSFQQEAAVQLSALPPLSLYVHVPWCVRKCPYCDFNSHALPSHGVEEPAYIAALLADLESQLPWAWGRWVQSIFIGGGTPSVLSPGAIEQLLAGIRARLRVRPDAEITLEANPGSTDNARLRDFRAAGINRLSLGVQSFNDAHLQALGRIHSSAQARTALELAHDIFPQFNLDLMFALPGQTQAQALADIDIALQYAPPHLSLYQLTLEPNTAFAHTPPDDLPDDDETAQWHEQLLMRLAAEGLQRYEVSALARSGHQCVHNVNYWQFGDYLGIGAGAHGKLSFAQGILRTTRPKSPAHYQQAIAANTPASTQAIAVEDLPFEFMLNVLRLADGVPAALWGQTTGLSTAALQPAWERCIAADLMVADPTRLQTTPLGWQHLNTALAYFLPS